MLQIASLDVLATGEFVPYRDAQGRPRLLDARPPMRASKPARQLDSLPIDTTSLSAALGRRVAD